MATDATGPVTTPDSIATYDVNADRPTGVGLNNIVASIQTAFNNHADKPAGIVSGEVPVWNGSAWVRSSVTNIGPTSLGSGTPDNTKFLRGDGSWQVVSGPTYTYATTPPGSPVSGDIWYLVDSTTAPTYQWTFRYNSGSSHGDKWEFVGGAPARVDVAAAETTASTSYVALTTAGPSFTVPRGGVYQIQIGMSCRRSGGAVSMYGIMSYDIGGTGAVDGDACFGIGHDNNNTQVSSPMGNEQKTLTASTALVSKYKVSAQTIQFDNRWMSVTPLRVS